MENNTEIINLLGYVKPSKYRKSILVTLDNGKFKIPSEIADEIGTITSHVSSNLRGLKEKGLVKCLNEDAKKGRLYFLTKKGKNVLKHIKKD